MKPSRLRWISKAIEYDMLTNSESNFLFNFIENFTQGKLTTKTNEEMLEELFAEIQWREFKTKSFYEVWNKKQEEKEPVLEAQS